MKISIIGTAGRGDAQVRMTRDLYFRMVRNAQYQLSELNRGAPHLVSGGAAIADHIAVSLFLMKSAPHLTLYFPCKWSNKSNMFLGNKVADTANYYHRLFSQKMGKNTLLGIQEAIDTGATYHEVMGGFHARNLEVGKADIILAYTWGEGKVPADGGTKHCWDHSSAPIKIHIPLSSLEK